MHFLIYVDTGPTTETAVRLGAQLAAAAGAQITLLCRTTEAPETIAAAQALLPTPAEVRRRPDRRAEALLAESKSRSYDLIIAGSRGRRGLQRLALGSMAAELARRAKLPVLLVKGPPRAARGKRVLACTSGDARGERAVRWGARLANWLGAELTVLHVMSQLALSAEAPLDQLSEGAEEAIAQQTREGQHLARALEVARSQTGGAPLGVQLKLRHGLVLDEIVAEAREGGYDLVVIGGHPTPEGPAGWRPVQANLLEDVADQVISALDRPVLVVKGS
jgi:nucleotide-binding universal stress UspA family protein